MKWSMFIFKTYVENEGFLMLNTLNHSIVFMKKNEWMILNDIIEGKVSLNQIDAIEIKESYNKLIEMGFIIDAKIDEQKKFMNNLFRDWNNDNLLSFFILPTTNCNFACPYCYEFGIKKENMVLSKQFLTSLLSYLEKYIDEGNVKVVNLILYGGEPTVHRSAVEVLLPRLKETFKTREIHFNTEIVSNGYLLSPSKSEFLRKFNWNRLQLTVDGPKDVHDKRRMLKNGQGTFEEIMKNLNYIISNKLVKNIDLRINYDKKNCKEIPKFLAFISDRYDPELFNISFGNISNTIGNTSVTVYIKKNAVGSDNISECYSFLIKAARHYGFKEPLIYSPDGMCIAKRKNTIILMPNGDLYRCLSMVGREEFKCGNIFDGTIRKESYLLPELYKDCFKKQCPFIPFCHTGCRFDSFVEYGTIETIKCNYENYRKINSEALKEIYYARKENS